MEGKFWRAAEGLVRGFEAAVICARGSVRGAVSGVGVGAASFRIASRYGLMGCSNAMYFTSKWWGKDVQATERFAAGSVYFVRLGSGDDGRLGVS